MLNKTLVDYCLRDWKRVTTSKSSKAQKIMDENKEKGFKSRCLLAINKKKLSRIKKPKHLFSCALVFILTDWRTKWIIYWILIDIGNVHKKI